MEDLFLIYVHYTGEDSKRNHLYEFIFSDILENLDGDDWDSFPASAAKPSPPHDKFIKKVGKLETKIKLDVVQVSDTFCVWDALDGVVALAYENLNDYEQYPKVRLVFKFGEPIKKIEDLLYEKDLTLDYSLIRNEK